MFHARDGEEALDFLYHKGGFADAPRPDIIITCLNLPKVNGHEVLATVREDEQLKRIPVVVLTNSESEEDIDRAYLSGASGYMTKPVDKHDFEDVVRMIWDYWNTAWISRD